MLEAGLSSLSLEPALQRQPPPVISAVPVPVSYGAYGAPPPQLLAPSHFQQSATDIMQDPAIMSFRFCSFYLIAGYATFTPTSCRTRPSCHSSFLLFVTIFFYLIAGYANFPFFLLPFPLIVTSNVFEMG
jgi:hypothetical protein